MDSIKTNIVNSPQMSKVDTINFADGQTWSAATYQRVLFIPEKARISGFQVIVSDAVTTTSGANTFEIGHALGTLQTDAAMVNVAAAADPNAYAKAITLEVVGFTGPSGVTSAGAAAVTAGVELMGKPPTMTSSATYTYAPSLTSPWSSSGEKVVPVVGYVTTGQTQTAGALHWWVEYVFDANIVWTQAALA
jgi:hypothetical protein